MSAFDLNALLARLVEVAEDALLAAGIQAHASPFVLTATSDYPALNAYVSSATFADSGSEELARDTYTLGLRVIVANAASDYTSNVEALLNRIVWELRWAFAQREWLQPAPAADLWECRLVSCAGLRAFGAGGVDGVASYIGTELAFEAVYAYNVEQAFYGEDEI